MRYELNFRPESFQRRTVDELELPDTGACQRCEEAFQRCLKSGTSSMLCFTWLSGCQFHNCPGPAPPTPDSIPPPAPTIPPGPKCPTQPARPILSSRSSGPGVKVLQALLNARGANPPLRVDGDFGIQTHGAVLVFQRARKIKVDGIVGLETWRALGC